MKLLTSLLRILRGCFRKTPTVHQDEPLARFLTSKTQFSIRDNYVKLGAFLPNKNNETSVFRVADLSEQGIWDIGDKDGPRRTIYGRADFGARCVETVKLRLVLDKSPSRHSNIVGWPADKDEQKAYARDLANMSQLKIRP